MSDRWWHQNDFRKGDRLVVDDKPCEVVSSGLSADTIEVELRIVHDDGFCTREAPCLAWPNIQWVEYEGVKAIR